MAQPRKALGKGFTALVPAEPTGEQLLDLPLDQIIPNRYQPRKIFKPEELSGLAASLKTNGVIQPIIVRAADGGKYELIAGERRWRAAQIAGLSTLPAWVRQLPEVELLEWALVENLHREDLNLIETAQAYQRLITESGFTQEKVSERVGQERSTVANTLRLLQLSEEIQRDLSEGRLTMGHAKAILSAGGPEAQHRVWLRVVSEKLTVRQTEAASLESPKSPKRPAAKKPELVDLEGRLSQSLGTKVRIESKKKGGKIVVEFYSLEELDRLLDRLL